MRAGKRAEKKPRQMYQACLDIGKNIGHQTCSTCGMIYTPGEPNDEKMHTKYHDEVTNGVKLTVRHLSPVSTARRSSVVPSLSPHPHLGKSQVQEPISSDLPPPRTARAAPFPFRRRPPRSWCCAMSASPSG